MCLLLVEAGRAILLEDGGEGDGEVGVHIGLDALLEHFLGHADDRGGEGAAGSRDKGANVGEASPGEDVGELLLAELKADKLESASGDGEDDLGEDTLEEDLGRPVLLHTLGLEAGAGNVDWVEDGLGDAARRGTSDHLLLEVEGDGSLAGRSLGDGEAVLEHVTERLPRLRRGSDVTSRCPQISWHMFGSTHNFS